MTVLFLLQLLLLVKFSLFCVVFFFFFWRSDGVWWTGNQLAYWHYFILSSFALHSLHFELSPISISVSLDSLLYHLFLRLSSIAVHVRRSTHLLLMITWCTFHNPEGFPRRVPLSGIRCNKGYENHKLKYVKGEENHSLSILKALLLKYFEERHALWQYHLHVNSVKCCSKMTGRPPFLPRA